MPNLAKGNSRTDQPGKLFLTNVECDSNDVLSKETPLSHVWLDHSPENSNTIRSLLIDESVFLNISTKDY